MRILRLLLIAVAVVVVAGTVASAGPPIRAVLGERPSPSASIAPEASPTEDPEAEPSEAPESEPSESPEAEPSETDSPSPEGDEATGTAPDFSACVALHGLENAICRHEALLAVDPGNVGLRNSLERLLANQPRHEEHAVEHGGGAGNDGSCSGHSCEPHGKGNGNG